MEHFGPISITLAVILGACILAGLYFVVRDFICRRLKIHSWRTSYICSRCGTSNLDIYKERILHTQSPTAPWTGTADFIQTYNAWCKQIHAQTAPEEYIASFIDEDKRSMILWFATRGEFGSWNLVQRPDDPNHSKLSYKWDNVYTWRWWKCSHLEFFDFIQNSNILYQYHFLPTPNEFTILAKEMAQRLGATKQIEAQQKDAQLTTTR